MKKRIDMNKVAREITLQEGGKISISIAQVKEVCKLLLQRLAKEPDMMDVFRLIERYK